MTQSQLHIVDPATIDTHGHIVPPTLVGAAKTGGAALGVRVEDTPQGPLFSFDGLPPLRPAARDLANVEAHLQWMERQGLDLQVLSSWTDIHGYSLPAPEAASWARLVNEHLARVVADHGDRFRGLATVPVQDGALASRELEYAASQLGMLGTLLSCDPMGHDVASPDFEPFWEASAALDLPVILHPPTHAFGGSIRDAYLTFSLGRPLDTTLTATRLIFGGLFDRHPDLKLVLVHGGGYLPYQLSRIDYGYLRHQPPPTKFRREKPSDYLSNLYIDTVLMPPPAIRFLRDLAGANHLMLGSDFVFSGDEEPIAGPTKQAGLDAAEVGLICCGTARRILLKA